MRDLKIHKYVWTSNLVMLHGVPSQVDITLLFFGLVVSQGQNNVRKTRLIVFYQIIVSLFS